MTATPAARLVIADDHQIFRSGLRLALADVPEVTVVGEASSGPEVVELCERLQPDMLVLDMQMPDMMGTEVVEALHARDLRPRVLVLSAFDASPYVTAMQGLGARGYVTKSRPPSTIQSAVRTVAEGGTTWYVETLATPLTPREQEMLVKLAEGLSNEQIARAMNVGESTVRNTLTRIYEKVGVDSARAAVSWAWANGLLAPNTAR